MLNWKKMLFGNKEENHRAFDFLQSLPGPSLWALRAGKKELFRSKLAGSLLPKELAEAFDKLLIERFQRLELT